MTKSCRYRYIIAGTAARAGFQTNGHFRFGGKRGFPAFRALRPLVAGDRRGPGTSVCTLSMLSVQRSKADNCAYKKKRLQSAQRTRQVRNL